MKKIREIFSGNEGFTLIELLIVIVIIGVLAAIAVPNIAGLGDNANEEALVANMRTFMVELETYRVQPDQEGKSIPDSVSKTTLSDFTGFSGAKALDDQKGDYNTITATGNDWDVDSYTTSSEEDKTTTVNGLNSYKITLTFSDGTDDIVIENGTLSRETSTTDQG